MASGVRAESSGKVAGKIFDELSNLLHGIPHEKLGRQRWLVIQR